MNTFNHLEDYHFKYAACTNSINFTEVLLRRFMQVVEVNSASCLFHNRLTLVNNMNFHPFDRNMKAHLIPLQTFYVPRCSRLSAICCNSSHFSAREGACWKRLISRASLFAHFNYLKTNWFVFHFFVDSIANYLDNLNVISNDIVWYGRKLSS